MWRAALRGRITLGNMLSGLVNGWIDTGKTNNGTAVREPTHIADFGYKLCSGDFEISKSFRDEMIKKEQTLEIEIQKQIDELVIKNAGGL